MDFYRKQPIVSIGVLSLITIFTVLLITSFSMLIFISAQTDMDMSEKTANSVIEHYAADVLAEEKYVELEEIWQNTSAHSLLESKISEAGFSILQDEEYEGLIAYYDIPVNDKKYLHVQIGFPDDTSNLERISWRIVAIEL